MSLFGVLAISHLLSDDLKRLLLFDSSFLYSLQIYYIMSYYKLKQVKIPLGPSFSL